MEISQKIRKIRKKIERQPSVFSNKQHLDSLAFPSKLVGRDSEIEQLLRYLLDLKNGMIIPFISVYGRSGSGKSTIVTSICSILSDIASVKFANLRMARTVFGSINIILNSLGLEQIKSGSGLNDTFEKIENTISDILNKEGKSLFILVLDEFDLIFSDPRGRPSDFLHKLLAVGERLREKNLWFCIISISNNAIAEQNLDDRVKSRIGSSEVFFTPYNVQEIFEILQGVSAQSFAIKVDDSVLQYCSELCSVDHGDARRALETLRVAGEICNGTLTNEFVDLAVEKINNDKIHTILKKSNRNFKIVFVSLARLSYLTDKQWVSSSEVYRQYCKILVSDKAKPLGYRRFYDILKELEQAGLAASSRNSNGRYGMNTKFSVIVPAESIKILNEKIWEGLVLLKQKRFEMLHNPKYNQKDHFSKITHYEDELKWRKIVGLD